MTRADFAWHGGCLAQARATFGEGPEPWIDLSTGINPLPWPGAGALEPDWHSLPDPQALAALEAIAARHFCVDPALCCAVPGSEMALRLLGTVTGQTGAHLAPAYRTHAVACPEAIDLVARPPSEARLLLLANPNNPDGRIVPAARLEQWLHWQERSGGWLVVDEAFADAAPQASIAPLVQEHRRLIVLRSFGKFFGLAGVRLGFVLAPPPIIAAYRQVLGDWPLSVAALAIGAGAYADEAWIAATRLALPARAAALDAMLRDHGFRAWGACPLFRLIETDDAGALFERLARRAILTRPFAYHSRWLRLGLSADERAMARLDRALADG